MGSSNTNVRGAASSSTHRFPWRWNLSDLAEPPEDAPTVFSTFACGGGSSMGYKLVGYRVVGNCEIDEGIAEIYERNLHPERSYVMDIREFNKLDDLPGELFDLDVLDGSPPCSTFSMQGDREKAWGKLKMFKEGQAVQTLDDLFFVFLDTVEKLKPKAFVSENVTGLLMKNAKGYVNEIINRARSIGYDVQLFRLNSAYMGVPQDRTRVFIIGNRMGWPRLSLNFNEEPIMFGSVRSTEGSGKMIPVVSEYRYAYRPGIRDVGALRVAAGQSHTCFSYRIADDSYPAPTLCTVPATRACDWTLFTEHDEKAVSTFPMDYDFGSGDSTFITGMSVPPVMMANVAYEIKRQWLRP